MFLFGYPDLRNYLFKYIHLKDTGIVSKCFFIWFIIDQISYPPLYVGDIPIGSAFENCFLPRNKNKLKVNYKERSDFIKQCAIFTKTWITKQNPHPLPITRLSITSHHDVLLDDIIESIRSFVNLKTVKNVKMNVTGKLDLHTEHTADLRNDNILIHFPNLQHFTLISEYAFISYKFPNLESLTFRARCNYHHSKNQLEFDFEKMPKSLNIRFSGHGAYGLKIISSEKAPVVYDLRLKHDDMNAFKFIAPDITASNLDIEDITNLNFIELKHVENLTTFVKSVKRSSIKTTTPLKNIFLILKLKDTHLDNFQLEDLFNMCLNVCIHIPDLSVLGNISMCFFGLFLKYKQRLKFSSMLTNGSGPSINLPSFDSPVFVFETNPELFDLKTFAKKIENWKPKPTNGDISDIKLSKTIIPSTPMTVFIYVDCPEISETADQNPFLTQQPLSTYSLGEGAIDFEFNGELHSNVTFDPEIMQSLLKMMDCSISYLKSENFAIEDIKLNYFEAHMLYYLLSDGIIGGLTEYYYDDVLFKDISRFTGPGSSYDFLWDMLDGCSKFNSLISAYDKLCHPIIYIILHYYSLKTNRPWKAMSLRDRSRNYLILNGRFDVKKHVGPDYFNPFEQLQLLSKNKRKMTEDDNLENPAKVLTM